MKSPRNPGIESKNVLEGARLLFESTMEESINQRVQISTSKRGILRNIEIEREKKIKITDGTKKRRDAGAAVKSDIFCIGNTLIRNGYTNVQMIAFARVPVIKLRAPKYNLDIDLIMNKKIATYNSDLIREYLHCDSSGKVKKAAIMLKYLVKAHDIGDASTGSLSSYSWVVMLLHTLLHHEYLPPLQRTPRDPNSTLFCEGFFVGYTVKSPLPSYYEARLAGVTVAQLLILFTEYITNRVDIAGGCLTLRGRGDVLPKSCWIKAGMRSDPWCLSIEASTG